MRKRKRAALAQKRADFAASIMDAKQLEEAFRSRGIYPRGLRDLEHLREIFSGIIRPEIKVRLHATSRWVAMVVMYLFVCKVEEEGSNSDEASLQQAPKSR